MRSLLHRLYWIFLVVLISGCSGGGCSGCAGGAIQPIPGGYPLTPDTRIPRAAQIRLTESGLRRVEAIAPSLFGGFLTSGIPVPRTVQPVSIAGFTACRAIICQGDNCRINVTLPASEGLRLSFADPNAILARARIQASGDISLRACCGGCNDSCGGFLCATVASPTLQVRTENGSHPYLGLSTKIAIARDTHAPRLNYHRADIVSPTGSGDAVQETAGEGIENEDIRCTDSWVCGLVNILRGTIIGQFRSQFAAALGPIQDALAASSMPSPPGCPAGTTVNGARCRYADGTQVPLLLGTEGAGNLGALLAGFSPGLNAPVSLVFAAGDPRSDATVGGGGMTLNAFGAMQSQRHNVCVPRLPAPAIPTIPEWAALRMNRVPGTTTDVDLGIGLAEEYLNYSFFQLWDAGMFCLAAGTNLSQMLNSNFLSALPQINSLRQVVYPGSNGPLAIVLRPQQPPRVRVGSGANPATDPLLLITFPRLALDFYAWSEERFVRFMTATTDLGVPVNLQADATGITPSLGEARVENVSISNNQLLSNNPALIGTVLSGLLGPLFQTAGAGLAPIALPAFPIPGPGGMPAGSVHINVPPHGIQGVTEGSSRFLGIFAGLSYTPAARMPDSAHLDTAATLDRVQIDPSLWTTAGLRRENLPRVSFTASTPNDFGHGAEYSYRVDQGTWSLFSGETRYEIQDWAFLGQGRHRIEVRARMQGEPTSADAEPAPLEFTIDALPPTVVARIENGQVVVTAHDDVSEALEYAYQFNNGPVSAWTRESRRALAANVTTVRVRVRDEAANVAEITVGLERLIRGGTSTDASSGCGCSVPGNGAGSSKGLGLLAAALGAAFFSARRRRAVGVRGFAAVGAVLATVASGCAEQAVASDSGANPGDGGADASTDAGDGAMSTCQTSEVLCPRTSMCMATPACTATCMPGFTSTGMPTFDANACTFDMAGCMCVEAPALLPGAVGSHLHMAAGAGGALWLSAWSPGDPVNGNAYNDLVVGRWQPEMMAVQWVHADGVPAMGAVTNSPRGWRGGVSDEGDKVGQYNSIAVGSDGNPRVSYWDQTNNHLKFATCAGAACTAHTVDANGSNGRYTSIALLDGDVPMIAYRAAVPATDGFNAVVRVARANSATPASAADWTITDAATLPSACRASDCAAPNVCLTTGRCGPMPMNAADVRAAGYVESLSPGALFINLVRGPMNRLALVWYNRDRGNLMLSQADAMGHFAPAVVIDGEGAMAADTGERGIYASAAFGADGVLHLAYVDGWEERLLYLRVMGTAPMGAPEVIDDGSGVGTTTFDDGKHIVGDSASISVGSDGAVRVAYQDSTQGTLRLATRGAMGWTRSVLDMTNHTGYWAAAAGSSVATYWRDLTMSGEPRYGVRVFPAR